ncbi:MAG TPA: trypsin-like peptidase domain-containing protein [Bryobacteraceae bacterium]|nr:trypsin-like peptidase domain-containing protein [Bryobacteraceae bacterium]
MKRFRYLIMAGIFAGAFVYLTTVAKSRFFPSGGSLRDSPLFQEAKVNGAGLSPDELNNIEIYKAARAATVNISSTVYRRGWFAELIPSRETGSGFVIDGDKGLILTNNHVLAGGQKIVVTFADQSKYDAEVLAKDPGNDLGLIRINPRKKLPTLRLGESEHLQVGQKVLAIGNPFGFDGTLTTGIISSLNRNIRDEGNRELEGMVQTDAAINPGNSGGPLLDSQGSVIGINTAIYGPGGNIGIGFAMPIAKAKVMLNDFRAGKSFKRPFFGVQTLFVQGEWAEALRLPADGGLLVQSVQRGTAADRAGIRGPREFAVIGNYEVGVGGDLIMAIDGKPCETRDAIASALAKKRAGDVMELTIFRGGRSMKVTVTLGEAPEDTL